MIAACALMLAPAAASAQVRQLLTRAELEAGGWTRLSELMFASRGVARTSVDGITVLGSATGMPQAGVVAPGQWAILVDGQPVPVELAGSPVLDLLPVSLAQVESVTVHRTPTFAAGRVVMRGTLRLYTRRIARSTGEISFYSGNEAGDPGPFAFTPRATPNVDNSGPFLQARGAVRAGRWDADAAVRRWTDNLTDQRLSTRYYQAAAPETPELWVRQIAQTLRAGTDAPGGRHDVHAGVSQLRGTFFVPSVDEDQSLSTRLAFAGASGHIGRTDSSRVHGSYRMSASRLASEPYGAPLPSTLQHARTAISAGAEATIASPLGPVSVGVSADRRALAAAPYVRAFAAGARVEGDVHVVAGDPAGMRPAWAALTLGRGIGGLRSAAVFGARRSTGERADAGVTAGAELGAVGDRGHWIDLALLGVPEIAGETRRVVTVTADWTRRTLAGGSAWIGAGVRSEDAWRAVAGDTAARIPEIGPRLGAPYAMTVGALDVGVQLPDTGRIRGGVTYRAQRRFGADRGAEPALDRAATVPDHVLDASVVVTPAYDIRVRPALHLASATRWPAGSAADATVPAVRRIDLSIEKWFFGGRLRGHLLARNLLNAIERYHPLGADFRLRVFAGGTATF